ncbi:hypothetical protein JCM16303_002371 [Sporobolomyces ruberrimus]
MTNKLSVLLATVAGLATTVTAFTPAYTNSTESEKNSTFFAGWRTDQGQGTLNQGVTLLSNGTNTEANSTYYGVVVYFNETLAVNQTSTPVPFIAFVSCDSNPSTQATLQLPLDANGTVAMNSTLDGTNSTISGLTNSTDSMSNSTISGTGTNSTSTNSTTMINGVNSTYFSDIFNLAAEMGASSVLLYSEQAESCQINSTANAAFNGTIPIFTSPSRQITNLILSSQFANIDEQHRYFNSTLLTASASNLSSIITSGLAGTQPTEYLVGRLTASYNKNDSSNGVVATIGRAPSSTRTAEGSSRTTNPGQGGSNPSSGAESSYARIGAVVTLLVAGIATLVV